MPGYNPISTSDLNNARANGQTEGADAVYSKFSFFIIRDAAGTELFRTGQVYPIAAKVKKGFKQAVAGRSVNLEFANPTVQLLGVRNGRGNAAKPYFFDERRGSIVKWSQLTNAQKADARSRFNAIG